MLKLYSKWYRPTNNWLNESIFNCRKLWTFSNQKLWSNKVLAWLDLTCVTSCSINVLTHAYFKICNFEIFRTSWCTFWNVELKKKTILKSLSWSRNSYPVFFYWLLSSLVKLPKQFTWIKRCQPLVFQDVQWGAKYEYILSFCRKVSSISSLRTRNTKRIFSAIQRRTVMFSYFLLYLITIWDHSTLFLASNFIQFFFCHQSHSGIYQKKK